MRDLTIPSLPPLPGVGYKPQHFADILNGPGAVGWLEVHAENYMGAGGRPHAQLRHLIERFPLSVHGVGLSIGGEGALDADHLTALRRLCDWAQPSSFSEHLAWSTHDGAFLNDLLPLPYTEATLRHLVPRVAQMQDLLECPFLLENVSSYVRYRADEMNEWEFIGELVARTGCELLLDVNNVYVNSVNHGFDPHIFIDAVPAGAVRQIHLAGHEDHGDYIIDTHDHPICDAVWDLYAYTVRRLGTVPTMIERDDNIPPLAELIDELDAVRLLAQRALAEQREAA